MRRKAPTAVRLRTVAALTLIIIPVADCEEILSFESDSCSDVSTLTGSEAGSGKLYLTPNDPAYHYCYVSGESMSASAARDRYTTLTHNCGFTADSWKERKWCTIQQSPSQTPTAITVGGSLVQNSRWSVALADSTFPMTRTATIRIKINSNATSGDVEYIDMISFGAALVGLAPKAKVNKLTVYSNQRKAFLDVATPGPDTKRIEMWIHETADPHVKEVRYRVSGVGGENVWRLATMNRRK